MEFPQRVYTAHTTTPITVSAETYLLQMQVDSNEWAEIIRFWVTPDVTPGGPSFQEARLEMGVFSSPATGGTTLTPQQLQGGGEGASNVTVVADATHAGTLGLIQQVGMSYRNGYYYIPHPDERIMVMTGRDNFGCDLLSIGGDDQPIVQLHVGIVWRELS